MATKKFSEYAIEGNNITLTYDNVNDTVTFDVNVDKNDVGLGNVDNTSDANKPISTATQTALNAKQDTLVSGTNIKTVNSNSLVGSGDVVIDKTSIGLGNVTNVDTTNASNISSGTLSDSRLSTNVTTQGNTFNAANKLVQLDGTAKLPAVDGSQLTNLPLFTPPDGLLKIASAISTTFQRITDYLGNASVLFLNSRRVGIGKDTSVTTQSVAVVEVQDANTSIVLKPNGTGAIIASVPDGTVTGGNARGNYAVDLQMVRNAATQVGGTASFVVGARNTASGTFSVAIGDTCTASNTSAFAVGTGSVASGQYSVAMGSYSTASGLNAVALGSNNNATSNYSAALSGQSNTASTNTHATVVGGNANTSSGQFSVSGGANNVSSGSNGSLSFGRYNTSSGYATVAMGYGNSASNTLSGVLCGQNNNASGNYSTIIGGLNNVATGIYSSILGGNTNNAANTFSLASGSNALSYLYGGYSHSSGKFTNDGDNQITNAILRNSGDLISNGNLGLFLDSIGASFGQKLIPNGNNRAWNVQIDTIAVVTAITGTATGVSVGDCYRETKQLLFKRIGGTSSIVGTVDTSAIKSDTSMSTAALTVTAGASQQMALTFTAPTFAGGGSVTCRVVSKVSLVEVAY